MAVMNLTTYGFTVIAARILGPVDYGAFAAMMGLALVLNVVALGLQATGARLVTDRPDQIDHVQADLLRLGWAAGVALGLLCLAAAPLLTALLHLESWVIVALLGVATVPLTVMGSYAGVLQGARRWFPLSVMYLMLGVGRLAAGLVALAIRPDAVGAMTGVAVGGFAPYLVGLLTVPRSRASRHSRARALLRELSAHTWALLVFLALSNVDVVIARTTLDQTQAGLYAGGLILTKAVLFLPQFVVVLAFPSLAAGGAGRRRAQRQGLALVGLSGLAAVGGTLLLPGLAGWFVGGDAYGDINGQLWAFAALGCLLAAMQLLFYDLMAGQRHGVLTVAWAALAVMVVGGVGFSGTPTHLLTWVSSIDVLLVALLLVVSLREGSSARSQADAPAVPPGAVPDGGVRDAVRVSGPPRASSDPSRPRPPAAG